MLVALEIQHGIDHVFQHARAGNRAVFGHVSDQYHGDAHLFRHARQLGGAFAYLRHGTWGGGDLVGIHGLDGVDDDDFGLMLFQRRLNRFHADFGKQVHAFGGQFQTLRAQGDLLGGFFAGNVQHFAALRHFGNGLQQQRRFADAGSPPSRMTAPSTKPPPNTRSSSPMPVGLRGTSVAVTAERDWTVEVSAAQDWSGRFLVRARPGFLKRVPLAAMRAFALPFRGSAAAFGALVDGFGGLLP